jgi:acyl-coenzyme A synthetase/AMP-(fatty) acid ligase
MKFSMDPIVAAFDRHVARHPEAAFVVSPLRHATRAHVAALAGEAQRALTEIGVRPGQLVVTAVPNGPAFLAALVAVRRLGAAVVLADAATPEAERDRIAGRLQAVAALTCVEAWPEQPGSWRAQRTSVASPAEHDAAAFVKLTSGSTGEPSGLLVTSEALAADDDQLFRSMGLRDDDRMLVAIPLSHSYGLSSLALPALRRGTLLALSDEGGPWAPLAAARASDATFFPTVPVFLTALVDLAERPRLPASLRLVISAGAVLPPEVAARFRAAFGLSIHGFYGASEVGGICYDREGGAAERGTVGTPVDGVGVTLRADDGEENAAAGTVVVRSAAAALGHIPAPQDSLDGGTFTSGDQARWTPSGELQLLGRRDAWINVGGKKVNPREVEAVLVALPGVREAVVLGVASPGGATEIVRAVVACETRRMTYNEVASWCRARLASYKVPRSIVLVEAIPRTSRGKIDRAALLAAPAPSVRR